MLFQFAYFQNPVAICEPCTSVAQHVHMFVMIKVSRDIGQGRAATQNNLNHLCMANTGLCTCGYVQRHLQIHVSAIKPDIVVVPTYGVRESIFV